VKKILIIGCGPGSPEFIMPAAVTACRRADVLLGAKRILDLFEDTGAERIEFTTESRAAIKEIETRRAKQTVAVLVSGDPGIFSLGTVILKHFGRKACTIIPGISSVQLAFARIGLDWADACILSMHHVKPQQRFTNGWEPDKIAMLSGKTESVQWIAELLKSISYEKEIFVCQNLGLDNESVSRMDENLLQSGNFSSKTLIISVKKELLS
jgi:precorrin-6y C5,15-methyltransferase (decarboxylating) CbiE subunit